jgi:hypothetical protein
MDFAINGDFSIIVNTGSVNIANTYLGANCKILVYGSVDGTNYVALDSVANKNFDTQPYFHIYDYDTKGKAPYMKIALDGHGSGTETIKIAVIPH